MLPPLGILETLVAAQTQRLAVIAKVAVPPARIILCWLDVELEPLVEVAQGTVVVVEGKTPSGERLVGQLPAKVDGLAIPPPEFP